MVDVTGVGLLPLHADKGCPFQGIGGGDGFRQCGTGGQALAVGVQGVQGQCVGAASFLRAVKTCGHVVQPGIRLEADACREGAGVADTKAGVPALGFAFRSQQGAVGLRIALVVE